MTRFHNKYRIESARLQHWDYSNSGWYFVTICTHKMECFFGDIHDGVMHKSAIGNIAERCWNKILEHCPGVAMDEFIVMPNHMHGIIIIQGSDVTCRGDVSRGRDVTCNVSTMSHISPKRGSLGAIIRSYKSAVTRQTHSERYIDFKWQERYYDHIIRSERDLRNIRNYIYHNVSKWLQDEDPIFVMQQQLQRI